VITAQQLADRYNSLAGVGKGAGRAVSAADMAPAADALNLIESRLDDQQARLAENGALLAAMTGGSPTRPRRVLAAPGPTDLLDRIDSVLDEAEAARVRAITQAMEEDFT
jgi:hypothetical protein